MAEFQSGDKVQYRFEDKWRKGVVHGVRKADSNTGEFILSYLIDTGEDFHVDEVVTAPGEDNYFVRQPEQVDVRPEDVKAV